MGSLFDVYIAVDWSSRVKPAPLLPTKDAVWVGEKIALGVTDTTVVGETYHRTRWACLVHVRDRLLHHASNGRRVFLGFDFAYGYPAGYAAALKLTSDSPPWRQIWKELAHLISDGEDNANNRFKVAAELNARCGGPTPGPLWGCPAGQEWPPTLRSTSPRFPYMVEPGLALERLRSVERRQSGVQEVWKLFGAGSVGGQALVGIPVVRGLREDPTFKKFSCVWPFETGFTLKPTPDEGPFILHAEIFPGNVPDPLDADAIPDQAQVRAVVRWLSRLDEAKELAQLFVAPSNLSAEALDLCVKEEGWIVGSA